MHAHDAFALGILVFLVTACSGANDGVPRTGPVAQQQPSAGSPAYCGSAIFAPVPELVCRDLPLTATASDVNALPGGYWSGQFVNETQDVQGYVEAMVSEDGRFQMQAYRYNENNLCFNWEAALAGTVSTAGNALGGSGRLLAVVPTLADGTTASDLHIDGTVKDRSSMIGKWSGSSGDAGCFVLDYSSYSYDSPSALANLTGDWTGAGAFAGAGLSVAEDGTLSGTDSSGCDVAGFFGLIDDRYSLYEFEADLASCAQAGHYAGLAWHGHGWDPGEFWLQVRASNDTQVLKLSLISR